MSSFINNQNNILKFATVGSVDNGNSTLIGRLLLDSKAIFKNQLEDIKTGQNDEGFNLAFLTDGLKRERQEGITIDVAYRYFSTPKRKFIIADSPGHVEYTRNMVTGASNANAALILIDARNGLNEQIKRHTVISSLLRISHLIVCVNKMDLIIYSEKVFNNIRSDFENFATKLSFKDITFIPISALKGDNIVKRSSNMEWYQGSTLLYNLENIYTFNDKDLLNLRFPVQKVITSNGVDYLMGTVAGGVIKKGDELIVLPDKIKISEEEILIGQNTMQEAYPPYAISIKSSNSGCVKRGNLLIRPNNLPVNAGEIDSMLCWFDDKKNLDTQKEYIFQHLNEVIQCKIKTIIYKLDINTLHRDFGYTSINANDVCRVNIKINKPIYFDSYSKNKIMGSFILIDPETNNTVAAGMIR